MNRENRSNRGVAKILYFATGTPDEAARDLRRMRLGDEPAKLVIVAPAARIAELRQLTSMPPEQVIPYHPLLFPLLWFRAWIFLLALQPVEVICLSARQKFRFLKLLALSLRGRVSFSTGMGARVSFNAWELVTLRVNAWYGRIRYRPKRVVVITRVGVIGSASSYYLKRIVPVVRARFPEASLHALLPASLEKPASGLFESVTTLEPGFWRSLRQARQALRRAQRCQCWIVPCTDEPYRGMKVAAFLLPLRRKYIYNELADGFPVREVGTFWNHLAWRARDRLSFQIIVAGTAGRVPGMRVTHLLCYALRLAAAIPPLLRTEIRAVLRSRRENAVDHMKQFPSVDIIYMDSGDGEENLLQSVHSEERPVRLALTVRGAGQLDDINTAIRQSKAEFICFLDRRCKMLTADWLDRLLAVFDDRTAQAGPQILNSRDGSFLRGLLLDGSGAARWNSESAVSSLRRPGWLGVDALPGACLVVRRSALVQAGYLREDWDGEPTWTDLLFARRLVALGWHSICNQNVTATMPIPSSRTELDPTVRLSRALEKSEERR